MGTDSGVDVGTLRNVASDTRYDLIASKALHCLSLKRPVRASRTEEAADSAPAARMRFRQVALRHQLELDLARAIRSVEYV